MYYYEGSDEQLRRLSNGTDHCGDETEVLDLRRLITDGLAMDPATRVLLETPALEPKAIGVYIYAVGRDGDMRVARNGGNRSVRGIAKHETLFRNEPVLAAGEVQFRSGVITALNDKSGSYRTVERLASSAEFRAAIRTALEHSGIQVHSSVRSMLA